MESSSRPTRIHSNIFKDSNVKRLTEALKENKELKEKLAQALSSGQVPASAIQPLSGHPPQPTSGGIQSGWGASSNVTSTREVEELKAELSSLRAKIKRLEGQTVTSTLDHTKLVCDPKPIQKPGVHVRLEKRLSLALEEKDMFQKKTSQLSLQLNEEKERLACTEKEKVNLESNIQQLSSLLENRSKELREKLKDADSLKKRCDELEQEVTMVCKEKKELDQCLGLKTSQLLKTQSDLSTVQSDLSTAQSDLSTTQSELDFNVGEVGRSQEVLKFSEQMYNDLVRSTATEIGGLQTEVKIVTGDRNKLRTEMFDLTSEKDKLYEKTKYLQDAFNEVQEEAEGTLGDFEQAGKKLKEVEKERDLYIKQRDAAWNKLTERNEKIKEVEKEIEEMREVCRQQVEEVTKDFESERKSREELAENLKAMQKVNKSMETEIISLREKINEQSRERMYYTSTFDEDTSEAHHNHKVPTLPMREDHLRAPRGGAGNFVPQAHHNHKAPTQAMGQDHLRAPRGGAGNFVPQAHHNHKAPTQAMGQDHLRAPRGGAGNFVPQAHHIHPVPTLPMGEDHLRAPRVGAGNFVPQDQRYIHSEHPLGQTYRPAMGYDMQHPQYADPNR